MSSLYRINHLFGLSDWPGEIGPNTKKVLKAATLTLVVMDSDPLWYIN